MAFSIVKQPIYSNIPGKIVNAYNSIWYQTSSDLYTFPNYRYAFNIYSRWSNTSELLSTMLVPPAADNTGIADVSKVLKDYVSYDFTPFITATQTEPDCLIPFFVDCGEQISGAFVTSVANQGTLLRLTLSGTYPNLNNKKVYALVLPGLTLSASTLYLKQHSSTQYDVYSDSALTVAVTATGTFSAMGGVQTTDFAIPLNSDFKGNVSQPIIENLAINAVSQYETLFADLNALSGTANQWLTNSNAFKAIKTTDYETISLLVKDYVHSLAKITYKFYDSSGSLLQTSNVNISFNVFYNTGGGVGGGDSVWDTAENTRLVMPVGYQNLVDAGIITTITPTYYTVQCFDSGGTARTSLRTYYVSSELNTIWDSMQIAWKNPKGGFDYYRFKMVSDNGLDISKHTFNKPLPPLTDINLNFDQTAGNRSETVFHSDITRSWTLNSDWVNYQESVWLSEIFTSPEVYLIRYFVDGEVATMLTPVTVIDNHYSFKIRGKEKLKQVTVTVKAANKFLTNV